MRSIVKHGVDVGTLLSVAILTAAAGSSSSPMETMVLAVVVGAIGIVALVLFEIASRTRSLVG
jgi:hypothetical protein